MKAALRLIAPLLALSPVASARIGESLEKCSQRYGAMLRNDSTPGASVVEFTSGGVITICHFRDSKCVAIVFNLIEPDRISSDFGQHTFPQDVVDKLLLANGTGWKRDGGKDYAKLFVTSDGTRKAYVGDAGVTIQLVSDISFRAALITPESISSSTKGF